MTIYTPSLRREILPTAFERLADRLYTRSLRFRARVRVLMRCVKHSRRRVKVAVLLLALYTVSPLELIPDIIPVLGALDELLVLALVVWYVRKYDPAVARALTHLFR